MQDTCRIVNNLTAECYFMAQHCVVRAATHSLHGAHHDAHYPPQPARHRLSPPLPLSPAAPALPSPSRSAWSPRCRASRRWPAKPSRAACTIAIDEINAKGGLLGGRKLELVRRDDEANPAKGVTAARELIFKEKVAVLFGGLDTPVSMAIVPLVNQEKVPFMGPWAAGTGITKNGANPNFAFRVSAVDEIVDVGHAALRAEDLQGQQAAA